MRENERIQQLREASPAGVMFSSQSSFGATRIQSSSTRVRASPPPLVAIDQFSGVYPPIFRPYYNDYEYDFRGFLSSSSTPGIDFCRSQIVFPTACGCLSSSPCSIATSQRNSVAVAVIKNRHTYEY